LRGSATLCIAKRPTLREHCLLIDILPHNLEQCLEGIAMADASTLFYCLCLIGRCHGAKRPILKTDEPFHLFVSLSEEMSLSQKLVSQINVSVLQSW